MENFDQVKADLEQIKDRNRRVELDKKWETSWTRIIAIAALTYILVVVFFHFTGSSQPFINAIVPTLGFLLSTLSISLLKSFWIQFQK